MDNDRLVKMAWEVMQPRYNQELQTLNSSFQESISKNQGSQTISEVAVAAAESRVDTLLLEADRIIPGSLVIENGTIEKGELEHPELDDLLDDISELVILRVEASLWYQPR